MNHIASTISLRFSKFTARFRQQLLYQDRNVGVHYEYSIPKKFSQQADPDSYTWVTDEFSECSSTCGGGTSNIF